MEGWEPLPNPSPFRHLESSLWWKISTLDGYLGTNESVRIKRMVSFQEVKFISTQAVILGHIQVSLIEMSSFQGIRRGISLYTEVSSFQGVGIEEFHCIQRCPNFRGLE